MPLPRTLEESFHNDSAVRDLPDVKDMTPEELERFVAFTGKENYRSRQIMKWVYRFGVGSFEEMTDLSKAFRQELKGLARISELEIRKSRLRKTGRRRYSSASRTASMSRASSSRGNGTARSASRRRPVAGWGVDSVSPVGAVSKRNLRMSEITDQITVCRFSCPKVKRSTTSS